MEKIWRRSNRRSAQNITSRIALAKAAFKEREVLVSRNLKVDLKKRPVNALV